MLYWIVVALAVINIFLGIFTTNWLATGGWTVAAYGYLTLAMQKK